MLFSFFWFTGLLVAAQSLNPSKNSDPRILDTWHYSQVFNEIRNYRVFFPRGYFTDPSKRYPVIYFFHGWAQRYFGSVVDYYAQYDKGTDNDGDNMLNFVSNHQVIIVKLDGYDQSEPAQYNLTPYNVGKPETFRQFPLYFQEFVKYFDGRYRTIPDRTRRAVSGLSMGGFMSFWLSGKYPHLVSAAGSFCGSPEFHVGPVNMPVEYKHANMYGNYAGVNVWLHYGDQDNLRFYHRDLNKIWPEVMDNYQFRIYPAAHITCGLGDMFRSFMETFKDPPEKPQTWDHIDVYPEFTIWDYHISSNRFLPGYTILENVNEKGFTCSVRNFLPDGELMPFTKLVVTTAPIYQPDQEYTIHDIEAGHYSIDTIRSDQQGRLKILLNGAIHHIGINQIGINQTNGMPFVGIFSATITNLPVAVTGEPVEFSISVLNKGSGPAKLVKAELEAFKPELVNVLSNTSFIDHLAVGEVIESSEPFSFQVNDNSIEIVKFKITMTDQSGNQWNEFFEMQLQPQLPVFEDYHIADGREFTISKAGVDSATLKLGTGNGDGKINPGESIVVLVKDQGKYHPSRIYTSDQYVNPFGVNVVISDSWSTYDHVGGSAKYSIPVISSDCPENHSIEMIGEYWLPRDQNGKDHSIKKFKIEVEVTGKDQTPPQLAWARVTGDNALMARIFDGAEVTRVHAKLIPVSGVIELDYMEVPVPTDTIKIELNDQGISGDVVPGDFVFSNQIEEQSGNFYQVEINVEDRFGNESNHRLPEIFLVR
ncbi:MAG: hypothetical protein DHS20C17_24090 [Cyclobacteriaceae bacterium]|nr:MAG: hypothetical protein DHS20C17_24090 [Cyclobacteriaceae bacterium]